MVEVKVKEWLEDCPRWWQCFIERHFPNGGDTEGINKVLAPLNAIAIDTEKRGDSTIFVIVFKSQEDYEACATFYALLESRFDHA